MLAGGQWSGDGRPGHPVGFRQLAGDRPERPAERVVLGGQNPCCNAGLGRQRLRGDGRHGHPGGFRHLAGDRPRRPAGQNRLSRPLSPIALGIRVLLGVTRGSSNVATCLVQGLWPCVGRPLRGALMRDRLAAKTAWCCGVGLWRPRCAPPCTFWSTLSRRTNHRSRIEDEDLQRNSCICGCGLWRPRNRLSRPLSPIALGIRA